MISSDIKGVKIIGITSAVPTHRVDNTEYAEIFGEETVQKTIESTGVKQSFHAVEKQIASDLAYVAAKNLFDSKTIDPASIGILLFISPYQDYVAPATACVLQKRLGISTDCIAYDINLGCSGFIYGLQTACSLLNTTNAKRALILLGDLSSRIVSPKDTSRLLFGDSGAATLIEKTENEEDVISFGLKTDGHRFKEIYIPAPGYRHPNATRVLEMESDGHERSPYNSHMNGTNVFAFSVTDVPKLVREFMAQHNTTSEDYDMLFMHQPNYFIIKNLVRKLKFNEEKVPISLDRYGNTSGVSIPMTLCDYYGEKKEGTKKILSLGFGVGLSWGVASMDIDTDVILPIIHSDEYFEDGLYND